jgi:hypothetical protein
VVRHVDQISAVDRSAALDHARCSRPDRARSSRVHAGCAVSGRSNSDRGHAQPCPAQRQPCPGHGGAWSWSSAQQGVAARAKGQAQQAMDCDTAPGMTLPPTSSSPPAERPPSRGAPPRAAATTRSAGATASTRLVERLVLQPLTHEQRAHLDGPLPVDPELRTRTRLSWLREAPELPSAKGLRKVLDRLAYRRALDLPTTDRMLGRVDCASRSSNIRPRVRSHPRTGGLHRGGRTVRARWASRRRRRR